MELFKGLTQEEFKELRSIIIDIGLIIEYGVKDWRKYILNLRNYPKGLTQALTILLGKADHNINLIIQGVLNE